MRLLSVCKCEPALHTRPLWYLCYTLSMKPVVFFAYVRKSTDESNRQVLSIQAQLFELQELAKREGITIARVFEESRTAKEPGRPQFNLMLSEIERGKAQAFSHGIPTASRAIAWTAGASSISWTLAKSVTSASHVPLRAYGSRKVHAQCGVLAEQILRR